MDFIQKINDLRAQKADLLAKAETFAQEGNTEEINKISDQMKGINASIASYEALAEESRRNADPLDPSDPKEYMLLRKGTAKQDWSIHVEFLTDQQCFRFVFRCNGAPKINSPMTIKNSSKTRSPFVTLAARA